jgi:putative thioredoxin
MSAATPTTTASFATDVVAASHQVLVLVDFWAPWCGPCRALGPVLDQVAAEFSGRLRVVKLNTDEEQTIAGQFAIRSIPAVKLFRHGRVVDEFVGALPLAQVRAFVERHLPRPSEAAHLAARKRMDASDIAGAIDALEAIVATEPDNQAVLIDLARCRALQGETAAARAILERLPPAAQSEAAVRAVYALTHFATLASTPTTDAVQQLRARAAGAVLGGSVDAAAELLLAESGAQRAFALRAGKEDLLQLFAVLGAEDARVPAWRRRLAALLN